jgi:hypothetical protein
MPAGSDSFLTFILAGGHKPMASMSNARHTIPPEGVTFKHELELFIPAGTADEHGVPVARE